MGQRMGSPKLPLIVILGSTGSGKTKLSLELAQKFGGEIIGADSMQIYRGLDIASAKATKNELSLAPHHMINILQPHEVFTVLDYRNRVLPIIDDIFKRKKIPIIVGGTNYYIESILWKILVQEPDEEVRKECGILPNNEHELSSEILHDKLKKLDPVMANRLHPNNRRKILRSLEVLYQKGKKHSEILQEQCKNSASGGGLRFQNALVFWLQCDKEILNQRLDERVDKMILDGLLEELLSFHDLYNAERLKNSSTDDDLNYTKGIYQSIGFKEFHAYLTISEEEKKSENGQKILKESVEMLKIVTRRYAKKQTKWTMNRFLRRHDREIPPIYGLNTNDVEKWNENVTIPAFTILKNYINCRKNNCYKPLEKLQLISYPNTLDETFNCEICDKILIGSHQYLEHIQSRKHRIMLSNNKKPKTLLLLKNVNS